MLLMSVCYWNVVVSDKIGTISEAAVAWFVSVHKKDHFDRYGENDCK